MFRAVAPEELPWPFIKAGIEQILRRCNASWTIDHVHARLLEGQAHAFVRDEGFVVLERCREPITDLPYLNVWLMWFKPGEAKKIQVEIVEWLDGMQKMSRCMWWQFSSPRDEWAESIAPFCDRAMTTWRRKE